MGRPPKRPSSTTSESAAKPTPKKRTPRTATTARTPKSAPRPESKAKHKPKPRRATAANASPVKKTTAPADTTAHANTPAAQPPRSGIDALSRIESWFTQRNWTPWKFQREAWAAYLDGRSGVIQVPTGAGKTFAAYMGPLVDLIDEYEAHSAISGLRILYITPLRAVSRDIERALIAPVRDLGLPITVETRTGDTSSTIRNKQRDRLPNVLITTPESLSLLIARENAAAQLAPVRSVIIDEWHELLASKRGTQTQLALARLRNLAPNLRTWALSATLPNLEVAAAAAVGVSSATTPADPPAIVRGEMDRPVIIDTVMPAAGRLPWAGHLGLAMLPDVLAALDPTVPTLVFCNTRSQAERWFHAIEISRPDWAPVMGLHHGSVDRDERERIEAGLKSGDLRLVVATSSLDLGVDFTPVERVFQIGSPKGIARLLQRAGRASHRPMAPCRITCVPTHALELVEIAAARASIDAGNIEPRTGDNKPLDVLAQHMVTRALGGGFTPDELFDEVRTAHAYRDLTRDEFEWTLSLVREGGGTLSAYPEYRKVQLIDCRYQVPSPRIAHLHRLNVGTITGDSTLEIRYLGGRSLGRIEENFVAHLREGERFVFAGKVLKFAYLHDLVAFVRPAEGNTANTPIWGGTRLPISESLAAAIRETLERAARGEFDSPELIAARRLTDAQQRESAIPNADETLFEICETREGSHLFVFPFEGRLVHGGLAALLALRLTRLHKATFATAVNDYGFEILSAEPFDYATLLTDQLFSRDNLVEDALDSVNISQLAKMQFREIARVAGLVMANYPGAKKTGRQLHASSSLIFDVLVDFDPGHLLLEQARREVLAKHFEESRLARTLDRLRESPRRVVRPGRPTPLSFPLLIERQSATLTSETIAERVAKMTAEWERPPPTRPATRSRSRAKKSR